ncbi:MAG: hypothetical protein ACD_9C00062G0001, partial [uncultured bacterium]
MTSSFSGLGVGLLIVKELLLNKKTQLLLS